MHKYMCVSICLFVCAWVYVWSEAYVSADVHIQSSTSLTVMQAHIAQCDTQLYVIILQPATPYNTTPLNGEVPILLIYFIMFKEKWD